MCRDREPLNSAVVRFCLCCSAYNLEAVPSFVYPLLSGGADILLVCVLIVPLNDADRKQEAFDRAEGV